jgi:hypothetical protein
MHRELNTEEILLHSARTRLEKVIEPDEILMIGSFVHCFRSVILFL